MSSTFNLTEDDRRALISLVLKGELSDEYLTNSDLLFLQETVMDAIIDQKCEDGYCVFSCVEDGLIN